MYCKYNMQKKNISRYQEYLYMSGKIMAILKIYSPYQFPIFYYEYDL